MVKEGGNSKDDNELETLTKYRPIARQASLPAGLKTIERG